MRKIDKTCTLSSSYLTWETALTASDIKPYDSSRNEFYWDVVMNLFHCQNGLCAYTEIHLCSSSYFDTANWVEGKYVNPDGTEKIQARGQLEHFDKTLKKTRPWKWDNLFMADTDVNTKIKSQNQIDPILKPDDPSYDEKKYLAYDKSKHVFFPHPKLDPVVKERVKKMILALGINYSPIIDARRIFITNILKLVTFGIETWDNVCPEQFPTAVNFIKSTPGNSNHHHYHTP
ncbi:MAG: hypothetical protein EOO06_00035 [Chitinophagaceae bacterium]|nr:MAG: hypothetical protein EOO06_00035 [Chitinophagaceae bacterium]